MKLLKKEDLIECIKIGYANFIDEEENEDNADYDPPMLKLPIKGVEAQYAWEFGYMIAREFGELDESSIDDYLEQILEDSDSDLTLNDLKI